MIEPRAPHHAMITRLLQPRSVAIVGASDKPGALGTSVLGNLERSGFTGDIHPINPNRATIGTRRCLPSVSDLPEGVDVAVLAIPRAGVLYAVRALAERRAGAAIIFSAGFAEAGPEGLAEQAEIARIAADAGMLIQGPNCLGLVNHAAGVPLTFVETEIVAPAGRPTIAIVSQSGAMAAVLSTTLLARELAIGLSVSTGNEASSGVEHFVEWLVDEDAADVIAMIVEQFRHPAAFLAAATRARAAGKRIVLLHPGTSSAARTSAATHTGAIAGDHKVMRAKVERAGIIVAETLEELGDIAEILLRCPQLAGGAFAVLGESGAFKALTLDLAEKCGLPLADLEEAGAPALHAALPPFVPVTNPLDITAQGLSQPGIYTDVLRALFDDASVGGIIAGIIQGDPVTAGIKAPAILAALDGRALVKPLVFAGLDEGADIPAHHVSDLRARNVPWFPSAERVVRACARLSGQATRDLADHSPPPSSVPGLRAERGVIAEYRAKQLLGPLGIAFPMGHFATSADEAVAAAERLGYPVAMKAQAAALSHKSDAGGVLLALGDAAAVRAAWDTIHQSVSAYDGTIALDGMLVEQMGARGVEMIVGARNDPAWGPIVLAGLGGVTAEIFEDVRLLTPDLSEDAIIAELLRLKSAPLLTGYRGAPERDLPALAAMIRRVSAIMLGEPSIQEMDLNPVIVHPGGQGVVALDALMLVGA